MFNRMIVNDQNLIKNIKQVKLDNPCSKICAMVKANAYGAGVEHVVKVLQPYVDYFGVACFFEALQVRKLCDTNILIVGPPEDIDLSLYEQYDIDISCHSMADVKKIINSDKKIKIHIKINTGMNRYGISSEKEYVEVLNTMRASGRNPVGLFTHFATKDEYVCVQMDRFSKYIEQTKQLGYSPIIHADNSAVNLVNNHHLDMVRIGFNLYNMDNDKYHSIITIRSQIVQINSVDKGELVGYNKKFITDKTMRVGVIPIGYADGFDCALAGQTIFVAGHECRVLNICMDCFMLDLSCTELQLNDEVEILGSSNTLSRYAQLLHTSEYEIMCKFGRIRAEYIALYNGID